VDLAGTQSRRSNTDWTSADLGGRPLAQFLNRVSEVRVLPGHHIQSSTPDALIAAARGSVWKSTDAASAVGLEARWSFSGLISHGASVMHVISPSGPIEGAAAVEPTLEDAYLLTIGATMRAA
jgi:hypothetical protein